MTQTGTPVRRKPRYRRPNFVAACVGVALGSAFGFAIGYWRLGVFFLVVPGGFLALVALIDLPPDGRALDSPQRRPREAFPSRRTLLKRAAVIVTGFVGLGVIAVVNAKPADRTVTIVAVAVPIASFVLTVMAAGPPAPPRKK